MLKLRWILPGLALTALTHTACSREEPRSTPLVTDVAHSRVKNQSIGNCWLYAAAGWAEALHLAATGAEVDLSESYWTWWFFYDQIVDKDLTALETGGWWDISNGLIKKRGYLLEGEFLADEAGEARSARQKAALEAINAALKPGGSLATRAQRTPEAVRAALDEAFGSDMAAAEAQKRDPSTFVVGYGADGAPISLLDAAGGVPARTWRYVSYDRVTGEGSVASPETQARRAQTLVRVMRALNDKQPVVMSVKVDFNAWDRQTGVFDLATLRERGVGDRQGGHMLLLEDYVVDDVPGVGTIDEGDASPELKEAALTGRLRHFVTKNSWGEGVSVGYHRFTRDYLDATLQWNDGTSPQWQQPLGGFILPPGY